MDVIGEIEPRKRLNPIRNVRVIWIKNLLVVFLKIFLGWTIFVEISYYLLNIGFHSAALNSTTAALAIGVGFFGAIVCVWNLICVTSARSDDPYRFSRRQLRFIKLAQFDPAKIVQNVKPLQMNLIVSEASESRHSLEFTRHWIRDPQNPRNVYPRVKIEVNAVKDSAESWVVTVEVSPLNPIFVGDFVQGVFNTLQLFLKASGWQQAAYFPGCPVKNQTRL